MIIKRQIAACAIIAGFAGAATASAAPVWPANVVGTWSGISNQSQIVLTVSSEGSSGKCQSISGTIKDVATGAVGNMLGYYCPGSGAVEFLRYPAGSDVAFQAYTANLSQKPAPRGKGILMGGVFSQYATAYGPLGQYSFSLTN